MSAVMGEPIMATNGGSILRQLSSILPRRASSFPNIASSSFIAEQYVIPGLRIQSGSSKPQ